MVVTVEILLCHFSLLLVHLHNFCHISVNISASAHMWLKYCPFKLKKLSKKKTS